MEPFFVSLALLVLSSSVLSEINFDINYDDELKDTFGKKYDIRGSIELRCKVTATENEKFNIKWLKEKKELKGEMVDGKYKVKLTRATEEEAGVYYCVVYNKDGSELDRANITLFSKYRVKTPDNVNVVEGEPLRITCVVHGRPAPVISWKVGNETYEETSDRILLQNDEEKNIEKSVLVIEEVQMSDRGVYTCIGTSEMGTIVMDETMVRIKDKYAALWPFLGICAEVFILCAIILIYEKKRNKAELEESDTDQSPDQKNTPDHGKDTNLRHRQ